MEKDMISVVVPIYNVKKYVAKCIESLINQTYSNLEIILVDDGATDGSAEICDMYSDKDKRIIVIHKQNGGLSDARNAGIEIAKGDYITFVDGDDYVAKDFIEYLYHLLKTTDSDVSMMGPELVKEDYEVEIKVGYDNTEVELLDATQAIQKMLLNNGVGHTAWGKLFKTSLWENARFKKGILYEDYDVIYNVFMNIEKCAYGIEKKYGYLLRKGSIMKTKFDKKQLLLLELSDRVTDEIIEFDYSLRNAAYRLNLITYCIVLKNIMDIGFSEHMSEQMQIIDRIRSKKGKLTNYDNFSKIDILKIETICKSRLLFLICYKVGDLSNYLRKRK